MTEPDVTVASVYGNRPPVPPRPEPRDSRASTIGASLVALCGVGGWWFALLAGAYVIEAFDFELGRVAAGLAAGSGVLVAMLNAPLTKKLPKYVCVAVALNAAAVFLYVAVPVVPPGYYAMRSELHRLDPPGWKILLELRGGNSICFDECTSIERIFLPNTNDEYESEHLATRLLKRHGYKQVERDYSGARVFRKGHFKVTSYADQGIGASPGYPGRPPGWAFRIEAA